MKLILRILFLGLLISSCTQEKTEKKVENTSPAYQLVKEVVEQTGSYEDLKKLKNVEYTYTIEAESRGIKNISTERYIFDGEYSWAEYAAENQMPNRDYSVRQIYDGDVVALFINDTLSVDVQKNDFASFLRKTNFYWFCMMQKLLDPGLTYKKLESREVDSIKYDLVEIGFEDSIGVVQDRYILYINPETKLVDQFLFTVKELDYSPVDPLLMIVNYEEVDGVKIMTDRYVRKSDWEGKRDGDLVYHQRSTGIKFNQEFNVEEFGLR